MNHNAKLISNGFLYAEYLQPDFAGSNSIIITNNTKSNLKKYYVMRWRDVDSIEVIYRTWKVFDNPDPNGIYYKGEKSGNSEINNAVITQTGKY
jgi:hypothetical protein